ncbi:glutathione peroxidase-like [Branchiostoma floridae x Branchiostoma japonicum]
MVTSSGLLASLLCLGFMTQGLAENGIEQCSCTAEHGSFHDHHAMLLDGSRNVSLAEYRGTTLLVVTVSTYSRWAEQYVGLNALKNKMVNENGHRFEILGFPTNNFGLFEPGKNEEILNGIRYVRPGNNYVPNFTMFQKGDCNGENEQSLFTYLKSCCPHTYWLLGDPERLYWTPIKVSDVRWSFEKFLVDPEGRGVKRVRPDVTPKDLEPVIDDFIRSWDAAHGGATSGARSVRDSGFMSWLDDICN